MTKKKTSIQRNPSREISATNQKGGFEIRIT